MKRSPNDVFLLDCHDSVVELADYLNILAYLIYGWCPDKDSLKRLFAQHAYRKVCFKRIVLPSKGIPLNDYVKVAYQFLLCVSYNPVICPLGQHYHTSTCSKHRHAFRNTLPYYRQGALNCGKGALHSAFATWQNEAINLFYLLWVTHHLDTPIHMQLLHCLACSSYVFLYVSLKSKNTNCN